MPATEIGRIAVGLLNRAAGLLLNTQARPVGERRLRRAVDGKVVLVTGASRGIGEQTARRLGAAGARVLLNARSSERLEQIAAEIRDRGGEAHPATADLAEPEDALRLAEQALDRFGRVDVLVSNAGKSINRTVAASTDRFRDYERTIALNYLGPVQLVLALLPSMRERGSGRIVNVSTAGVLSGAPAGWTAYIASKQAFDTFLRGAALELADDGIEVASVYMTLVATEMSAPSRDTFRYVPIMSAGQAADRVCAAVAGASRVAPPWGPAAAIGAEASHYLGMRRVQRAYYEASRALARRGRDRREGER